MDFDLGNAWWLGTSLANIRNKCPWSLIPFCKRQAVLVIIWWIKLEQELCVFAFQLARSCISRNPLNLKKLNSRGTTGINTLSMAFQAQRCQVHLCIFPPFPGKKGKFCRWLPKNWRRQQVASEIYRCLNPPTPVSPSQYFFSLFYFFPCST